MFVKPTHEKEVSKQNPDIKADLGVVGGKLSPLKAYYPKGFELSRIENAADVFNTKENLFSKIEHCPMCERKRREIVERLRTALAKGTTRDEKMKAMTEESNKIRQELGMSPKTAVPREKEEKAVPPALIPVILPGSIPGAADDIPVLVPAPPIPNVESREIDLEPEQQQILSNINNAIDTIQQTFDLLAATPEKIQFPSWR